MLCKTFSVRLTRLFSLNLKQELTVGILLVIYIHVLHFWLTHIVNNMLEVRKESLITQKSWGARKRTESFGFYAKAMLMRRIHRNNASSDGEKIKICEKHQTFEAIG